VQSFKSIGFNLLEKCVLLRYHTAK